MGLPFSIYTHWTFSERYDIIKAKHSGEQQWTTSEMEMADSHPVTGITERKNEQSESVFKKKVILLSFSSWSLVLNTRHRHLLLNGFTGLYFVVTFSTPLYYNCSCSIGVISRTAKQQLQLRKVPLLPTHTSTLQTTFSSTKSEELRQLPSPSTKKAQLLLWNPWQQLK